MSVGSILLFVVIAGIASYVQTLTGFAFALILVGGVALTHAMPIDVAAVFASILTLFNVSIMLKRGWRDVLWRELALTVGGSLPLGIVGYLLLDNLAKESVLGLRLTLGLVTIASAIELILPRRNANKPYRRGPFVFFGALSGLMSGLFSTSGPPLVYHYYRMPLSLAATRETLVTIFGLNAILRLVLVAARGNVPAASYFPALLAILAVSAGTYLARTLPPPVSTQTIRRAAFVLLVLSGVALAAPATTALF